MRVMVETDSGAVDACTLANAAINSRVAAVDYGGDGPRFVIVRLRARLPRGRKPAHKRVNAGSFADHLHVEGPLPEATEARRLIEAAAAALGAAPAKLSGKVNGRLPGINLLECYDTSGRTAFAFYVILPNAGLYWASCARDGTQRL